MSRALEQSVVYFVQIGKFIKIGVSSKLESRLKAFLTSTPDVELLLSIPGGRDLEQTIHEKLAESHLTRELFRRESPVLQFIHNYKHGGLEFAFQYLEATSPAARERAKAEERANRVVVARRTKMEKDAYFASLVADRKNRLGW